MSQRRSHVYRRHYRQNGARASNSDGMSRHSSRKKFRLILGNEMVKCINFLLPKLCRDLCVERRRNEEGRNVHARRMRDSYIFPSIPGAVERRHLRRCLPGRKKPRTAAFAGPSRGQQPHGIGDQRGRHGSQQQRAVHFVKRQCAYALVLELSANVCVRQRGREEQPGEEEGQRSTGGAGLTARTPGQCEKYKFSPLTDRIPSRTQSHGIRSVGTVGYAKGCSLACVSHVGSSLASHEGYSR